MLEGDAGAALADEVAERAALLLAEGSVELEVEVHPLEPHDMGEQVFGIEAG